jgi:hypothetical protein
MLDIIKGSFTPGVVVHTCNPSTQEVEAGGSKIQGQSWLQSKTLGPERREDGWRGEIEKERGREGEREGERGSN